MSSVHKIYRFKDFHVDAVEERLLHHNEFIPLEPRVFQTLLLLIENRGRTIKKEEFFEKVWAETIVEESNLTVAVAKLRRALKDKDSSVQFIETVPRKGYRFNAKVNVEVEEIQDAAQNDLTEESSPSFSASEINNHPPAENKSGWSAEHKIYVLFAGLSYGLLFWLALLLETSYKYDDFGAQALWLGVPIIGWMSGTTGVGLLWTENLVKKNRNYSFFTGALFFCAAVVSLCLILRHFIPDEPITVSRFQSQPAFAAYLKNAFIYFLPLGLIFILAPFYLVCGKRFFADRSKHRFWNKLAGLLRPSYLFRAWLLMLFYSIFSTFYLLNNLVPAKYHGLFVTLIFARFFIYFALGLGCMFWYYINFNDEAKPVIFPGGNLQTRRKAEAAALIILPALGLGVFWTIGINEKTPYLQKVEITSPPDYKRQLFVRLDGENFQPETIRVRVVGHDCAAADPCEVPNGALRKLSTIRENSLENVPLTLPRGEFRLFAQNGDSSMSNSIVLNVP